MLFTNPPPDDAERRVLEQIDALWNDLRYQLAQPRRWYGPLRRLVAAKNVQASNSIEGHNVSVEDAAALIGGGVAVDASAVDASAVRNYGDAMTYILQLADDPTFEYSEALIKSLHYSMAKHDLDVRPGLYRIGAVWAVSSTDGETVYEGPDADEVPALMRAIVEYLNEHEMNDDSPWIPAAMAHLNLAMVHPFKVGNGRMARALQTLVLSRARIQSDTFLSIEEYLGANSRAYYDVLAEVGRGSWQPANDVRPWIRFVLRAHFAQAKTIEKRIAESSRLWEAIDEERRAAGLDERTMGALYSAAWGLRVRRGTHMSYATEISERVATSDLQRLVGCGLLVPVGERRGRYYVASDRLAELRSSTRSSRTPIPDPFA
jgi:Fic family protein